MAAVKAAEGMLQIISLYMLGTLSSSFGLMSRLHTVSLSCSFTISDMTFYFYYMLLVAKMIQCQIIG
jgi:hypothetical protein